MRKYLWLSLSLMLLLLLSGLAVSVSLAHLTQQTQTAMVQVKYAASSDDPEAVHAAISGAKAAWERTEPLLNMLLNHEETDRIHFAIRALEACFQSGDSDALLLRCSEIEAYLAHLSQLEQLRFCNLL